jgi:hypothetical protein
VGGVRETGLAKDPPPVIHVPQPQVNDGFAALINQALPIAWVLRTAGDPMSAAATVRREVMVADPQQAVFEFRSMAKIPPVPPNGAGGTKAGFRRRRHFMQAGPIRVVIARG